MTFMASVLLLANQSLVVLILLITRLIYLAQFASGDVQYAWCTFNVRIHHYNSVKLYSLAALYGCYQEVMVICESNLAKCSL